MLREAGLDFYLLALRIFIAVTENSLQIPRYRAVDILLDRLGTT